MCSRQIYILHFLLCDMNYYCEFVAKNSNYNDGYIIYMLDYFIVNLRITSTYNIL